MTMKKLTIFLLGITSMLPVLAEVPSKAIPFIYDGHIYIQAMLQDTVPISVIYDTGANGIYIDREFMELSDFKKNRNDECLAIINGAGNSSNVSFPIINEPLQITMGDIKYKEDYCPILNLREVMGGHLGGMVGIDAFAKKTILINYFEGYILPIDKLNSEILKGFTKLPAQFKDNSIYIEAELKIDSVQSLKGRFILDTGCDGSIVLTNKVRKSLNLTNMDTAQCYSSHNGIGGDGTMVLFRANSFNFLDDLENAVVYASYNNESILSGDDKYLGFIGNSILSNYDLIIDDVNKDVYVRRNNNRCDSYQRTSRVQMGYIDRTDICDGWIVTSLFDKGIAQRAGFEIGDIILSINQRPVKDISWEEQRSGLRLTGLTIYEVKKKNGEIVTYVLNIGEEII